MHVVGTFANFSVQKAVLLISCLLSNGNVLDGYPTILYSHFLK